MVTEKLTTSCLLTALMLVWFMGLDMLGVDLGISLITWAVAAPLLLYPLLGRLTRAAAQQAAQELEVAKSQKMAAVLNYLHGQMDQSVRSIMTSCSRLLAAARARDVDAAALGKEAASIHYEAIKLGDALSKMTPALGSAPDDSADPIGRPVGNREGRYIDGYVRRG
jgi:hypothetical protein